MKTDTLDEVVFDGIRFLESLTRHYGAEKGMQVWEKMGEAVGDEIKGKVFFSMLTGESSNRIRIQKGNCTQAVAAIKAIRMATSLGLKEAKDAWDLSGMKVVTLDVAHEEKRDAVRNLRNLGMIVN
jgi:ribosomal protein L7/L12